MLSLVSPELIGRGYVPAVALQVTDIGLLPSVDALVDLEVGGLVVHFGTTLGMGTHSTYDCQRSAGTFDAGSAVLPVLLGCVPGLLGCLRPRVMALAMLRPRPASGSCRGWRRCLEAECEFMWILLSFSG